jgi:hypothetical protein
MKEYYSICISADAKKRLIEKAATQIGANVRV